MAQHQGECWLAARFLLPGKNDVVWKEVKKPKWHCPTKKVANDEMADPARQTAGIGIWESLALHNEYTPSPAEGTAPRFFLKPLDFSPRSDDSY